MNFKKIGTFILAAFAGGIISVAIFSQFHQSAQILPAEANTPEAKLVNYQMPSSPPVGVDFTVAAEKSVNAVVHVKTQYTKETYGYNPLYNFFFGYKGYKYEQPVLGTGSGVIISDDGYIVTNNHVVSKAEQIEVVMNNNKTYQAELIGTDPMTDVALLKIDVKGIDYLEFGNSDDILIGEWVLAVGNPFNLTSTVTAGIVSAKARNINILSDQYAIEAFIQTDAAVNPGNSGGALVNTSGKLIGINTAIASKTGSYIGYSFAIPSNIVQKIVADLIKYGEVQRAYLGVSIHDIDSKISKELSIERTEGVYISGVVPGGGSDEAGIKQGDIIIRLNDREIKTVAELQEQLSMFSPGMDIKVTVQRNNKTKTFKVTLRNREGNTEIVKTQVLNYLGAVFKDVPGHELDKLGIKHGVKISEIGSGKLKSAGIKEGFIITKINKKAVYDVKDIEEALKNVQSGGVFIEGVYPNGMAAYYAFGM